MTTTDGNGIVFYEETDPVSPLHTLLNTGQQSVSNAIEQINQDIENIIPTWQTFTPSWVNVTIGNGSTNGRYINIFGLYVVNAILNIGSSTNFTSATYVGSLPSPDPAYATNAGLGTFNLETTSLQFTGGAFRSGTAAKLICADGQTIGSKSPASGGKLSVNLFYKAAD